MLNAYDIGPCLNKKLNDEDKLMFLKTHESVFQTEVFKKNGWKCSSGWLIVI